MATCLTAAWTARMARSNGLASKMAAVPASRGEGVDNAARALGGMGAADAELDACPQHLVLTCVHRRHQPAHRFAHERPRRTVRCNGAAHRRLDDLALRQRNR